MKKIKLNAYDTVEAVFRNLQIMTSCYVAFALGANDVANAIGPASTVYSVISSGSVSAEVEVPLYLLLIGGVGITIGIATWGYKVIKTIGSKITKLTNTRGFSVDFERQKPPPNKFDGATQVYCIWLKCYDFTNILHTDNLYISIMKNN